MLTNKVKKLAIALSSAALLYLSGCAGTSANMSTQAPPPTSQELALASIEQKYQPVACEEPQAYLAFAADGTDSLLMLSQQGIRIDQDFDHLEAARVTTCEGNLDQLVQAGAVEFFVRHGGTPETPREITQYQGVREDDNDPILTFSTTWAHDVTHASAASQAGLTGQGVMIGILDTGVHPDVPAFSNQVDGFHDFVYNRSETYDDDDHGTACISIINRVVPDAHYIVYKIHGAEGYNMLTDVLEAFNQVIADRLDVLNNSWGLSEGQEIEGMTWPDANRVLNEVLQRVDAAGILISTSAGNGSYDGTFTDAQMPEGSPYAISTGATTIRGEVAPFSDLDAHVFAPGHLVSVTRSSTNNYLWSGTSFSGPFTTAAIVVIEQYGNNIGREFTRDETVAILQESGVPQSSTIIGADGEARRFEFRALDYERLVQHLQQNYR